jgi:hypothetical protein
LAAGNLASFVAGKQTKDLMLFMLAELSNADTFDNAGIRTLTGERLNSI